MKTARNARTAKLINPAPLLALAAHLEALEAANARRELMAQRQELLHDFSRVSSLISTCKAALPAECAVGDALEAAEQLQAQAIARFENFGD